MFAFPMLVTNATTRAKFLDLFSNFLPDGILTAVWFVLPWFTLLAVPIIGVCLFHLAGERRRGRDLAGRAAKMGLNFLGNVDGEMLQSLQRFEPFEYHERTEGRILNLCFGQTDEFYLAVFDYRRFTYDDEGGRTAALKTYLHVYSEHFDLPPFLVRPAGALTKLTNFLAPGIPFTNYPEFSQHFTVRSKDERRVREIITPQVISFFLAQQRSIVVEGAGQDLVLYIPAEAPLEFTDFLRALIPGSGVDNRMDPSELPARMELGRALLSAFMPPEDVEIVDAESIVEPEVVDGVVEDDVVVDVTIIDDDVADDVR